MTSSSPGRTSPVGFEIAVEISYGECTKYWKQVMLVSNLITDEDVFLKQIHMFEEFLATSYG